MKSIFYLGISLFLGFNLSSCEQGMDNEIEAELQLYFDAFVEEAAMQGVEISLDEIDIGGYIENIEERGTLGQCKSYSDGSKQVVIDQPYWSRATNMEREYLVFHELGHCLLDREHVDSQDASGICISIMQSGDGTCRSIYNLTNREDLMEELFEN